MHKPYRCLGQIGRASRLKVASNVSRTYGSLCSSAESFPEGNLDVLPELVHLLGHATPWRQLATELCFRIVAGLCHEPTSSRTLPISLSSVAREAIQSDFLAEVVFRGQALGQVRLA